MTYTLISAVYHASFSDINAMPIAAIKVYLERIPGILNLWKGVYGESALLPYMEDWSDVMDSWYESVFGTEMASIPATPGMLKLAGIGVEYYGRKPG
jgi:hypothetical protein